MLVVVQAWRGEALFGLVLRFKLETVLKKKEEEEEEEEKERK